MVIELAQILMLMENGQPQFAAELLEKQVRALTPAFDRTMEDARTQLDALPREERCVHCGESVAFGSGKFVNRVPYTEPFTYLMDDAVRYPIGAFACETCENDDNGYHFVDAYAGNYKVQIQIPRDEVRGLSEDMEMIPPFSLRDEDDTFLGGSSPSGYYLTWYEASQEALRLALETGKRIEVLNAFNNTIETTY